MAVTWIEEIILDRNCDWVSWSPALKSYFIHISISNQNIISSSSQAALSSRKCNKSAAQGGSAASTPLRYHSHLTAYQNHHLVSFFFIIFHCYLHHYQHHIIISQSHITHFSRKCSMWVSRFTQPPCTITLIWPHIKPTIYLVLCFSSSSITYPVSSLSFGFLFCFLSFLASMSVDKLWHLKEAWKKVEHLMRTQTLDAAKSLEEWNMTDSYNWHLAPDIWYPGTIIISQSLVAVLSLRHSTA